MKKSNLLKVFSILVLSVMVIFITTSVNADNTTGNFTDITPTLQSETGNNNANNANVNANSANTNRANTNNANTNTNRANTNNSSIYNNTNLPKTGIGDSLPIAALVVVFGISAVYAYKKIKDYRNI